MTKRLETTLRVGAALYCLATAACTTALETSPLEAPGKHDQAIVDVSQTQVERQTIGNCWVYASSGWAESLHLRATGATLDLSESY